MVRAIVRAGAAYVHGPGAGGGEPALAAARYEQWLHRIDRSLWQNGGATGYRYARAANCALRFSQRFAAVCEVGLCVCVVVHRGDGAPVCFCFGKTSPQTPPINFRTNLNVN